MAKGVDQPLAASTTVAAAPPLTAMASYSTSSLPATEGACIRTTTPPLMGQSLLMASGGLLHTQPSSVYWCGDDGHHGLPT